MALISVIICTYNPRLAYFEQCLKALRSQTLPLQQWELVIIDNCSDEPITSHLDLAWHPSARIIREEKLGLTPARLRGIKEAKSDLLIFVDDDNVLDFDYLEQSLKVADEKVFLGSWSGQCRGVFEAPPPEWTRRYFGNLVIREFDCDSWSNLPRLADTMPCGAGLCVRRIVAQRYAGFHASGKRKFQFDRTGDSLISGGDNDLAGCACELGLGVGLIEALKLSHLISPDRLTETYLSKLAEGIAFSSILLDAQYKFHIPKRGKLRHSLDLLRLLRLNKVDRRIQWAAIRGTRKALDLISMSPS
jgi:glycosyltransferase involved in cell wall biosynthesis